jgi:acid phosphatase family membrane protein YuiD
MGTLLTSPFGKRTLRPLTGLIDRRVDEALRTTQPGGSDAAVIADLRRELAELQNRQRSLELLLDGSGRGMARMPSPSHLATTARELAAITGAADAAKRNVACAFRVLVALEALGVGRVAGGTMNICGKLAAVPLLDAPNDDVLEIGTLYGLFAAALLRMLERAGRDPQLSLVDPLIGVQLQPGTTERPDASGTPVREAAVRTNLALAGAAGAATRVRQGYSTDPDVQADIGDRQYGAIIVDGDHSQDGVAADLRWVEEIVAPGGVVVLDDYGDRRWPGVQAALDEHLTRPTRLTFLGRVATSGYLRTQ